MVERELDLRQLNYFLRVAALQNISAAARELNMTQPALSRQIRSFEDQLGWVLLERGKKSVRLTRAGEVMQREGEKILASTRLALRRARHEIEGAEIKVGYSPSLASGLINRAMKRFNDDFPRVQVSWFDCSSQEMEKKLLAGELDLILGAESGDGAIYWERLLAKEMVLMVPRHHEFSQKRRIGPRDLDGVVLLLFDRNDYPDYWDQVMSFFEKAGINGKILGQFDGIMSLTMGVEAGLGVALVVEGTMTSEMVLLKKISPKPTPIYVGVGSKKGRVLAEWEQAFVQVLSDSVSTG